jgi:hypothetical protein
VSQQVAHTPTSAECLAWLGTLASVDATGSDCYVAVVASTYTLTLVLAFPSGSRIANNYHSHTGAPPASDFQCTSAAAAATCTPAVVDVTTIDYAAGSPVADIDTYFTVQVTAVTSTSVSFKAVRVFQTTPVVMPAVTVLTTASPMEVDFSSTTLKVSFASLMGHTVGAKWTLGWNAATSSLSTTGPGYREHEQCSGLGVCAEGACTCPTDLGVTLTGAACEVADATLPTTEIPSDTLDGSMLTYRSNNALYEGTLLKLTAVRSASTAFDFFKAIAGTPPLTIAGIDGSGRITSTAATIVSGSSGIVSAPLLKVDWTQDTNPTDALFLLQSDSYDAASSHL